MTEERKRSQLIPIPAPIEQLLGTLSAEVADALRILIRRTIRADATLRRIDDRTEVTEAKLEGFLQEGFDEEPLEPESLGTIMRRLDALEHRVGMTPPRPTSTSRGGRPGTESTTTPTPSTPPTTIQRRPKLSEADQIRFRLLEANRQGAHALGNERYAIACERSLTVGQVNAIWSHCQNKLGVQFVARKLHDVPQEQRVALRRKFQEWYGVPDATIIEWYKTYYHAENGNGTDHHENDA